jgi:hypothetical protein
MLGSLAVFFGGQECYGWDLTELLERLHDSQCRNRKLSWVRTQHPPTQWNLRGGKSKNSKISSLFKTKRLFLLLLRYVASLRNCEISCIAWIEKTQRASIPRKRYVLAALGMHPPCPAPSQTSLLLPSYVQPCIENRGFAGKRENTHTDLQSRPCYSFFINFFVLGMRKEAQRDSQRLFYLIITATEERVFYTGIL